MRTLYSQALIKHPQRCFNNHSNALRFEFESAFLKTEIHLSGTECNLALGDPFSELVGWGTVVGSLAGN
jgi:hypothetical protein